MRGLLRRFLFYTIALFVSTQILTGFRLTGGIQTYIVTGIILSLMMLILKPILQFLSLPLNFLTFGLTSFLVNAIILFLLTILAPQVTISPFTLPHISFLGFAIPAIPLNKWFAYLVASIVLSSVYSTLLWISQD